MAVTDDVDPLGDPRTVVAALRRRGLDPAQPLFVSYFVRFRDPEAALAAGLIAGHDGWLTASYRWSGQDVLRLSRHGPASARDLLHDRDYLRRFAVVAGGRWQDMVLEDFASNAGWNDVAERYLERLRAADAGESAAVPAQRATRRSAVIRSA